MARRGGKTYLKNREVLFFKNLDKYGEYTCEECKLAPLYRNKTGECLYRDDLLTADHIKEIARGGGNNIENLKVMCAKCNNGKSNKVN
jgi:5-methylcytosine-specific restriction endonuclease McrA